MRLLCHIPVAATDDIEEETGPLQEATFCVTYKKMPENMSIGRILYERRGTRVIFYNLNSKPASRVPPDAILLSVYKSMQISKLFVPPFGK